MEKMNITFLGTGNAVPTKMRNHTGIFVNYRNENILIDCGEGIQRQFKYSELSPHKLTKILITHWHGDHILGLPGLLQTLAMQNYTKTLHLYGPRGTNHFMTVLSELSKGFKINLQVHEINEGKVFENSDILIEAEQMDHDTPTFAYSIIIKDKIRLNKSKIKKLKLPNSPLLRDLQQGKDISFNNKKIKAKDVVYTEKGKKLTIVMDTAFNHNAISLAKDSSLLITESTFAAEEKEMAKEYKHLTSEQAAEIAKKSHSDALILTHISERYEHDLKRIEKEAKKVFKNTKIAKDFDSFVL